MAFNSLSAVSRTEWAESEIDIINPHGTMARGISFEQVDIDHHLVHLTIKNIRARVELTPLLLQTVRTKGASIDSVLVEIKRRKKPPIPATPFFLPRWLIVSFDHANIGSLNLAVYNGFHFEATRLSGSGIGRHRKIRLYELGLQSGNARLTGSGQLGAYDPLRLDFQTRIDWTPGDQPAWSVDNTLKGDLAILGITAHTIAPFRSDFTGQALNLFGQWHWQGNALVHDLDVTAWGGSRILGLLSGPLALKGHANGFAIHGPLDSSGLKAGIFDTEFAGSYSNHVLWAKHIGITHHTTGARVSSNGTIEVMKGGPRLDLRGTWQDFRWPLAGKVAPFHSPSGEFTLGGTWPYSVHATGMAQARELPVMPATIDGSLARDRFTFNKADIDLYGGHATVAGEAIWAPTDSWSVAGRVTDLNSALIRDDLPGKLSFNIATQGLGFDGNGDFSVEVHDIGGKLRGVPASGSGKVLRSGSTWQFDKLRVGLGGTNLALDGRINAAFDLRFAVTARDLSLLAPDSRGQLEGNGTIRGTVRAPTVAANIHGNGIQHEGVSVEDLDADIDFDPNPQYESRVDARIHNLVYKDRQLDNLAFKLNGKSSSYAVRLDARALGMSLTALANGPFNNGVWQGQLHTMDIAGTESLRLKLEHSVGLLVSAAAVQGGLAVHGRTARQHVRRWRVDTETMERNIHRQQDAAGNLYRRPHARRGLQRPDQLSGALFRGRSESRAGLGAHRSHGCTAVTQALERPYRPLENRLGFHHPQCQSIGSQRRGWIGIR